jgi:hypothetical protein
MFEGDLRRGVMPMLSVGNLARGWVGLAAALSLAPAAGALDITNLTMTINAGNTVDTLVNTGNSRSDIESDTNVPTAPSGPVADTIGSAIPFQTRYSWLVAADRDSAGSAFGPTANADYSISFTIDNPTGATYQVDIQTLRIGAFTNVDDEVGGTGTGTLGAMTGYLDGVVNGTLALATLNSSSGSTVSTAINQSGTTLTFTDNALTRTITLRFTWNGTASSNHDENAIRMGQTGGITGVTADDYPGAGGLARTQSGDGHLVNVTTAIISTPEPAPAALIGLGLVGLAILGRGRRTARAS